MRHLRLLLMVVVVVVMSVLGFLVLRTPTAHAANPPSDMPCRGCHDDTERTHTFPSGESVSLRVDLSIIDKSPHNSSAAEPVACNNCHVNETHYRYPHAKQSAESKAAFVTAIEQSCQECHYPHKPFHELNSSKSISATAELSATVTAVNYPDNYPTCVDCHGNHNIESANANSQSMTANCLACHNDKDAAWVQSYVPAPQGLGTGATGYIGSARCASCHEDKYFAWQKTLHSKMVQNSATTPSAIVGDFSVEDPNRPFTMQDVLYAIGSNWKQVYLSQTVEGKLFVLPAQWNVADKKWVSYHPDTGTGSNWLENCGSCHVTGLNTQNWGFTELSIGCEGCHGPGEAHAKKPKQVKLFDKEDDQVCGSCHSRGTSPEGLPYPATYRPGDKLSDHFTLATGSDVRWPDGSAKLHNQQFSEWHNDNKMMKSGDVTCTTCHSVHDEVSVAGQLHKPINELCLSCHNEQKALVQHIPFHEQAIVKQRHEFTCADCHMPKLASSATDFDIRSHAFTQPDPQNTIDHGGLAEMPNACNRCHTEIGQTPQWAAQTIAYAKESAKSKPKSFFGPGPTPTSPPPPTPISVVGQPPPEIQIGLGAWLRPALITAFWLIVALFLYFVYAIIRSRRVKNA
ncbi:MAG: cytochrome c3 family protein [Caldilineaceae bacterium]